MNKTNGQQFMSEPLTTHEIEDVLSSIRRLVSEDLRPAARSAAVEAPVAADAGKLLLTPALRIVPDAAKTVAVAVADAVQAAVPADLPPLVREPQTEGWPPVLPSDDDYEDEGLNSAAYGAAMDSDVGLAPVPEAMPDVVPIVLADAGDDLGDELIWSAPGEMDAPMTEDLEMAAPSATLADTLHEAPGHWTAQDVPGVEWVQEETDWVEPEPMAFVAHPRKSTMAKDPLARAWADRAEAEVREQLGGQGPRPSVRPPEVAVPEPVAAPQAAAEKSGGPGLFDGDDAAVDEESLREIVRDIIREELAGALGERITRNVRKLVRVEINRALTAREFE